MAILIWGRGCACVVNTCHPAPKYKPTNCNDKHKPTTTPNPQQTSDHEQGEWE